jgi:hypothetical protein
LLLCSLARSHFNPLYFYYYNHLFSPRTSRDSCDLILVEEKEKEISLNFNSILFKCLIVQHVIVVSTQCCFLSDLLVWFFFCFPRRTKAEQTNKTSCSACACVKLNQWVRNFVRYSAQVSAVSRNSNVAVLTITRSPTILD